MAKSGSSLSGIVLLYKSEGVSSQTAVNRVKRIFGVDKAGHTGTLDPLATGVLPVLVGRAVKASEFMLTGDKHYRATLLLGVTTDTQDVTGEVLTRSDALPSEGEVIAAAESFVGESTQIPPMYSAIKVGGKKLYELARRGETVEREPRAITVYSLEIKRITDAEYILDVHCSKGTYIRTLLADIGDKLGCGGTMKTLERTEAAGFRIENCYTLEQLEGMTDSERESLVVPVEEIFRALPTVKLVPFFARLARAGQQIYLSKIKVNAEVGAKFKLADDSGFFAIGEVSVYEDGLAIKPIRQFGKL